MSAQVRDMTKGSPAKLILLFAVPLMLGNIFQQLYTMVDTIVVGQVAGVQALAALGAVEWIMWMTLGVSTGVTQGFSILISQHYGAKKWNDLKKTVAHSYLLTAVTAILLLLISQLAARWLLVLLNTPDNIIGMSLIYLRIVFCGIPIVAAYNIFASVLRALGNSRTPLIAMIIAAFINVVLDLVFVAGFNWSVAGAALATGFGQCVPIVIYIAAYLKRPKRVAFRREYLHLTREVTKRLYSIGVPAILNMALTSVLTTALNAILAAFSQTYVLVLGIYYKLQTFLYMPANGIIQGMRPLIGYNYGAGEHKRVEQLYRLTLLLNICIMTAGMILCLTIPGKLMGAFAENPQTIQNGVTALHIICFGFILSAVSVTACGALEGLGKGIPSLLISLSRYVVLIIPLAFIFSRFFGAAGVWHAFWVTEALSAVFAVIIYRRSVKAESFIEAE